MIKYESHLRMWWNWGAREALPVAEKATRASGRGLEPERCQWQIQRDGCPPVRGMSRSDKGYAVSGEERMTHERTRDALACRSTRRFVIPYASWFKYIYICLCYVLTCMVGGTVYKV